MALNIKAFYNEIDEIAIVMIYRKLIDSVAIYHATSLNLSTLQYILNWLDVYYGHSYLHFTSLKANWAASERHLNHALHGSANNTIID